MPSISPMEMVRNPLDDMKLVVCSAQAFLLVEFMPMGGCVCGDPQMQNATPGEA